MEANRTYDERSYVDKTIATIRQHDRNALRESWWTGAALALADEVDRLDAALRFIRDGYDGDEFEDASDANEARQAYASATLRARP